MVQYGWRCTCAPLPRFHILKASVCVCFSRNIYQYVLVFVCIYSSTSTYEINPFPKQAGMLKKTKQKTNQQKTPKKTTLLTTCFCLFWLTLTFCSIRTRAAKRLTLRHINDTSSYIEFPLVSKNKCFTNFWLISRFTRILLHSY